MTIVEIQKAVCKWITDNGEYAVQVPDNSAARHGKYYAVEVNRVSQYGSTTKPPPSTRNDHFRVAQYVATVVIHEVAGDGEKLRKFRNDIEGDEFLEFIRSRFNDDDGFDRAFSVWDVGDIEELTINDSDFFIQQYVLSFRVQFNDFIGYNRGKILSVSGSVGKDSFKVERPYTNLTAVDHRNVAVVTDSGQRVIAKDIV